MSNGYSRPGSSKKRRLRIHEVTSENDIRYLGPLTYQHFKLLGWLCIVFSQVLIIVRIGGRLDPDYAASSASMQHVLGYIVDLALPFLLIANFAQILDADNGYGKQLLVNGAAAVGVFALTCLVFYRYIVGDIASILVNPSDALPIVTTALRLVAPYGFVSFNLFVDLFLCTLTMVFLNYTPRRVFTGRTRICFRLLALLPIAYEVGCMVLKGRAARGLIQLPPWVFPLLTAKPPMTFVLFVALALFVKTRELRFRRHGKTHEEFRAFLKTRRNSLNFSVFLAIMLVVVSLLDIAVVIGFSMNEVVHTVQPGVKASASAAPDGLTAPDATQPASTAALPTPAVEADAAPAAAKPAATAEFPATDTAEDPFMSSIYSGMRLAEAVGFGGSVSLFLLAPLVLLFSYTRKPKYPRLDLLIPVAGMAAILFVYLEGAHWLLSRLPFKKLDLKALREEAELYYNLLKEPPKN